MGGFLKMYPPKMCFVFLPRLPVIVSLHTFLLCFVFLCVFVFVFVVQTKRRMLGNIQFIGELYKKGVLRENVMKSCVEKLLCASRETDNDGKLKGLKLTGGTVDETNLEVIGLMDY